MVTEPYKAKKDGSKGMMKKEWMKRNEKKGVALFSTSSSQAFHLFLY